MATLDSESAESLMRMLPRDRQRVRVERIDGRVIDGEFVALNVGTLVTFVIVDEQHSVANQFRRHRIPWHVVADLWTDETRTS